MFDSGYKYAYDRYNDVYRFVPLNGDTAGLSARTDLIADAGSPADSIEDSKSAVKLAFNPTKKLKETNCTEQE